MEREQEGNGAAAAGPGRELGRATWTEIDGLVGSVLLVPVGSCEQHGPHLPLDTDTRIAQGVARALARRRDDVLVGPPIAYGSSGEHQSFPGTLSIGTDALTTVLVELGRSAFPGGSGGRPGHRCMVFVNGHGGNVAAAGRAVETLVAEGRPVAWWGPRVPGGDAHAGRTETSLLLALAAQVVGDERPIGNVRPVVELVAEMRAGGVAAVSADGVLGDATGASAEEGERLLEDLVRDLDRRVEDMAARS